MLSALILMCYIRACIMLQVKLYNANKSNVTVASSIENLIGILIHFVYMYK